MSLVCTSMPHVRHSYVLVCDPYVTCIYSYDHPYVTLMYSYISRMPEPVFNSDTLFGEETCVFEKARISSTL